jgi:uncharacterized membrane protein YfcA
MVTALAVAVTGLAFTLSASAGLGGSLILVPAMVVVFGTKQGIAIAALLLACNNIGKVVVYRHSVPLHAALPVLIAMIVGASLGAGALVSVSERVVQVAIILAIAAALVCDREPMPTARKSLAVLFALVAGATSGFAGTSGPLKGVALRSLGLERQRFVGAASVVSLGGDTAKAAVFLAALRLETSATTTIIYSAMLIPFATLLGRHINQVLGERAYASLFWTVMTGYAIRLAVV